MQCPFSWPIFSYHLFCIILQEAEVARLNARISGYERATFGTQLTPSRETTSKSQHPSDSASLMLFSNSYQEEASPRTSLRRSLSDAHLARTNAPRDSLLGYNIDGYDRHLGRDSIGQRESFDRIFRVADFPLDNRLLGKPGGAHPADTGYLPPNENNHHRYLSHHLETARDLAQTFIADPLQMSVPDPLRRRDDRTDRSRQHEMMQNMSSKVRHESNSAIFNQTNFQHQHSASVNCHQSQQQTQFTDDSESVDGENLNSLQNMLTYVNKQIAIEDGKDGGVNSSQMLSSLQESPSFAPLPDTPQKTSPSSTPGKVQPRNVKGKINLPTKKAVSTL